MMGRDDFTKRFKAGTPISVHEFLYPPMQVMTRVALKSGLVDGTDQKFNLLMGRHLQAEYGQELAMHLTMPPAGRFGRGGQDPSPEQLHRHQRSGQHHVWQAESISDDPMWKYFTLLSQPLDEIAVLKAECAAGRNPRDAKVMLAQEIVTRFHSAAAAEAALADFTNRARGGVPDDIPEVALTLADGLPLGIGALLKQASLVASTSEANRLIDQSGIRASTQMPSATKGLKLAAVNMWFQVGKRKFARCA